MGERARAHVLLITPFSMLYPFSFFVLTFTSGNPKAEPPGTEVEGGEGERKDSGQSKNADDFPRSTLLSCTNKKKCPIGHLHLFVFHYIRYAPFRRRRSKTRTTVLNHQNRSKTTSSPPRFSSKLAYIQTTTPSKKSSPTHPTPPHLHRAQPSPSSPNTPH